MADIPGMGNVGPLISSLGNNAFMLLMVVVVALIIGGIVAAGIIVLGKRKQYKQFRILIFQKDGANNVSPMFDEGGVFVDGKTGNKRLFLKNANVGLSPDNIPFLPIGVEKWVFMLRVGLKNYRYIHVDFDGSLFHFNVGEEDVNWAVNVYEAQKKRFAQNWLAQYLPFIIIGFTAVILLIMFIYLMGKVATIQQIASTMLDVSKELAAAHSGTTIISAK